jgi:hypothetical protein
MKSNRLILVLALIAIASNIVYLYPKLGYSPIPTQWEVGGGWGRYSIIEYGRIPQTEHSLTWQSDLKNYATFDVMPKILAAMITIVTGTGNFPEGELFHSIFSWVGIIFLPLVVLYFYTYVSNKEGKKSNSFDVVLLYSFSVFPLASTLISMSSGASVANGVARVLFLLLLVLLITIIGDQKKRARRCAIFIFLLFPFFDYHHTWSYYLFIYFVVILLLTFRRRNERQLTGLAFSGIVIFFTSAVYFNTNLLEEPGRIITSFGQILVNFPSVSHESKINPNFSAYEPLGSIYSYLQYVNSALILLICLVFFAVYVTRHRKQPRPYEKILFYFLITETLILAGLFTWNGISGVYARVFEVMTYVSLLLAAYLLTKSGQKLKLALRFMLLFSISIAVLSYPFSPQQSGLSVTREEFAGITFAGQHIPKTLYIFSDFRLGMPLLFFGQQGVKTIDAPNYPANVTEEILERCYYNVSNPESILDEYVGSSNYYVITSSSGRQASILDSSLRLFRPPSLDFEDKWSNQEDFNKIYSSDQLCVYNRVLPP